MVRFDREAFVKEDPEHGTPNLALIERMMNERQDLIARYAEKYSLEIDDGNRIVGEHDLLDFDTEAYDEWTAARSDMDAIRATAAAFGCEVERGEAGTWHAVQAQTRNLASGVAQAIDPKGRVVLQRLDRDALLFRGGAYQPFVVAHGYDERTGEWSHGSYLDTAAEAAEALNPKAVGRPRNGVRARREPER